MKRKVFSRLVLMVLCLLLVFTACANNNNQNVNEENDSNNVSNKNTNTKNDNNQNEKEKDEKSNKETESVENLNPVGEFPIVKETVTLSVASRTRAGEVEDFEENTFTKYLEDMTNVHIDWRLSGESEYKQKINLMLASDDYPDIIMRSNFSLAEQLLYMEQGILMPLNDLIDEYGVNTQKMFKDYPQVLTKSTLPNGEIVSLPRVSDQYHLSMCQKMWIYQPWLDALNLDMPNTTEEFYEVLKAFRDEDPNGNGKADEIPLTGCIGIKDIHVDGFLMNAFIYHPYDAKNADWHNIMIDGKVDVPYDKEEWKNGLSYLNRLYSEGLLYPDTFVQNRDTMRQLGENPDVPLLGAVIARFPSHFTKIDGPSGRDKEYVAVPPLEGPDGYRVARYTPYYIGEAALNITVVCKEPEVAMRFADVFFDEEVIITALNGPKGEYWDDAKEGQVGLDGKQAKWAITNTEKPINTTWGQGFPMLFSADLERVQAVDESAWYGVKLYNETLKYEPYKASMDMIVPPLVFNTDVSNELIEIETTLDQYVNDMTVKFITGSKDIESGFDSYLKELDKIGLERYLEIYNEAYDEKYQ